MVTKCNFSKKEYLTKLQIVLLENGLQLPLDIHKHYTTNNNTGGIHTEG